MDFFETSLNSNNIDNICVLSLPNVGEEYLQIGRYVLQLSPVPFVVEHISNLETWPSEESQNKLCKLIRSLLKFPLSDKYIKYFISCIAKNIDKNGDIFDDDMMELIIELQDITDGSHHSDSNVGYCGFLIDKSESECVADRGVYTNHDVIAIRMDKCHNQVGMKTWGAGIYLAEVLNNHPSILQNRKVIELGSGVGQTGVIACRKRRKDSATGGEIMHSPLEMCMTDYTEEILRNLNHNVSINTGLDPRCVISCHRYDWNDSILPIPNPISNSKTDSSTSSIALERYDILLAADCTYSEDLCDILITTIEQFLISKSSVSIDRYALLAATIRSPETFQHLQDVISASTILDVHDITLWSQSQTQIGTRIQFYCDFRENIRLYCCTLHGHSLPAYFHLL